jgi:predicted metal-dependent phosphoesterase TrpH
MPSKFYADLHIHSRASDGTFTPAQTAENAARLGLKAMSLTDHDTVAGVAEAIEAGKKAGIKVIPGIEMGSDIGGRDIHVLGYFVAYQDTAFLRYLDELEEKRLVRAEEMCANLTKAGIKVSLDDAKAQTSGKILTRAHIARAVVAKGYAHTINEVFTEYLGNGKPCFVPKYNLSSADVIEAIISAGGIPVLAHPKLSKIDYAISDLVEEGLAGLEVYCIDHNQADIKRYLEKAEKYDLVVTGGSDCHGPHTPGRFTMGTCGIDRARFDKLTDRGKWNSS